MMWGRELLVQVTLAFQAAILLVTSFLGPRIGNQPLKPPETISPRQSAWQVKSIDTVKFSRDLALAKLNDSSFDQVIDEQVSVIAGTGATHVAIATPYDERFLPFLRRWVSAARKHHLKVWFRGNFSGWEGWFGFGGIDSAKHQELTEKFILENPDVFENGDIFTACPECENGASGDPRHTKKVDQYRQFLVREYQITSLAFAKIGRQVTSNYDSMNLDVANLVMDPVTTASMGGVVTVDHYVADPARLGDDLEQLAKRSGGQVVLGEFGAPLPEINGWLNDDQQANWLNAALGDLQKKSNIIGLNYWTSFGGSTALWNEEGSARPAASVIKYYYSL